MVYGINVLVKNCKLTSPEDYTFAVVLTMNSTDPAKQFKVFKGQTLGDPNNFNVQWVSSQPWSDNEIKKIVVVEVFIYFNKATDQFALPAHLAYHICVQQKQDPIFDQGCS